MPPPTSPRFPSAGRQRPRSPTHPIPPPSTQAEPGGARLLWLGAQGCEAVAAELRVSARLVPPPSRRLGAFEVGYLPVAPTWD